MNIAKEVRRENVICRDLKLENGKMNQICMDSTNLTIQSSCLFLWFKQHKRIFSSRTHILLNLNLNILRYAGLLLFVFLRVGFLKTLSKLGQKNKSKKSVKKNKESLKEC